MRNRSRNLFRLFLLAAAAFACPFALSAAPFCVTIRGVAPQCTYYDAGECRKQAGALQAVCTLNDNEPIMRIGTATYCVVDSSRSALCQYLDRSSCNEDAQRSGSVCIDNTKQGIQPDPYGLDPKRRY
jgi:hypothetical protein